jgi:hypothetical protein
LACKKYNLPGGYQLPRLLSRGLLANKKIYLIRLFIGITVKLGMSAKEYCLIPEDGDTEHLFDDRFTQ